MVCDIHLIVEYRRRKERTVTKELQLSYSNNTQYGDTRFKRHMR